MIITIGGTTGSGKSTVAKKLAHILGYVHYSNGDFMREMAEERKISLLELSKIAEKDRSIDEELDQRQIDLGMEEDNFVIDSRLGFHFIPNSIKIFLDADFEERARRVFGDTIRKEQSVTLEHTKADMKRREESEKKRYMQYYGLNPYDLKKFELVIDDTKLTPDAVVRKIIEFVKKRK
jgi:cytidylate kinase